MKKIVFLPLLLLVVMFVIPGCVSVQTPVEQPSIGIFTSSPAAINPGESSNLVWNVTGANSVSIDQGIGVVNVEGARVISPAASTAYTISATNSAGTVTRTVMTTVNAPPAASVPFMVTNVTGTISPLTFTGTCPKSFILTATFTATAPGIATYRWERDDLNYSDVKSITFDAAGTKTATMQWDFSETMSGWLRVHVLTGDLTSIPVNYLLTCNGG